MTQKRKGIGGRSHQWTAKEIAAALKKGAAKFTPNKIKIIGIDRGSADGDDTCACIRTGDRMDVVSYKELLQTAKSRVNKYGAKRTVLDGVTYDSAKEAKYMAGLMWREKIGQVTNIVYHKVYRLCVGDKLICSYEADFVFDEFVPVTGNPLGDAPGLEGLHAGTPLNITSRVVDCKGYKKGVAWSLFQAKKNLMLACLGIVVEVV